eukprot:scaffold1366_cov43-Cyclotella_meneghiniana.AAC.4
MIPLSQIGINICELFKTSSIRKWLQKALCRQKIRASPAARPCPTSPLQLEFGRAPQPNEKLRPNVFNCNNCTADIV